jgi:hypothetical protein
LAKLALLLCLTGLALAQSPVPGAIRFGGHLPLANHSYELTFALYASEKNAAPLWTERQTVLTDGTGHYKILLGGNTEGGIPASLFISGEALWLGVLTEAGEAAPRAMLVSVPYAFKAADAETLGGRPASAYALAETAQGTTATATGTAMAAQRAEAQRTTVQSLASVQSEAISALNPVASMLAKFSDSSGNLTSSSIYDNGAGSIGIGTTNPQTALHLVGSIPYLRVDAYGTEPPNFKFMAAHGTSSAPTAMKSGDSLGQINAHGWGATGFSAYSRAKINFIAAENWSDAAQGSAIQFFTTPTGSTSSTERLRIDSTGKIGIGITAPAQKLSVAGIIQSTTGGFYFPDGTTQTTSAVTLKAADSSLTIASGKIAIATAGVATAALADASVTTAKLASASVTSAKLGSDVSATIAAQTLAIANLQSLMSTSVTLGANSFTGTQTATVSSTAGYAIHAINQASSGSAFGILSESQSSSGIGVYGHNTSTATLGSGYGVYGASEGPIGIGVYGEGNNTTGKNYGVFGLSRSSSGSGVYGWANSATGSTYGVYGLTASTSGYGVFGHANSNTGQTYGVYGATDSLDAGAAGVVGIATAAGSSNTQYGVYGNSTGYFGVGIFGYAPATSISGAPVGVQGRVDNAKGVAARFINNGNGNILYLENSTGRVLRVDGSGNLYLDGTTTAGGADFAERVRSSGEASRYHAGDLLEIDESADRQVRLSSQPYSTRVLGVYSTKPGVLGSRDAMREAAANELPVAMIGIVPCRASAENGPIHRGDLLVSSSTPGAAMRATDRSRMPGAIVGKALQPLESGTGLIEIAVTLQ